MSDAPLTSWKCPSCARQVPRNVEVCRCGSERRRLEALGYTFDAAPPPPPVPRRRGVESQGAAAVLIGYRIDSDLAPGWRAVLKGLFAVAVIAVTTATVRFTHTDPLPTRGSIRVVSTLESFTRDADPGSGNTIPAFLASAARIGVLASTGTSSDAVRDVDQAELQRGLCSQSVAKQIRHEYPGFYDDWPDDKLEQTVLEKYPEHKGRLCTLPFRLDAAAGEVIAYELEPRSLVGHAGLWLRTLLVTMAFAVACLNLYYRVIIGRLVSLPEDHGVSQAGRHAA